MADLQAFHKEGHTQWLCYKTINEGLAENNPKPFWKYIKSRKSDNIRVAPLKVKGTLESDAKKKAETLLSQFRSVFTTNESDELPPVKLEINDCAF